MVGEPQDSLSPASRPHPKTRETRSYLRASLSKTHDGTQTKTRKRLSSRAEFDAHANGAIVSPASCSTRLEEPTAQHFHGLGRVLASSSSRAAASRQHQQQQQIEHDPAGTGTVPHGRQTAHDACRAESDRFICCGPRRGAADNQLSRAPTVVYIAGRTVTFRRGHYTEHHHAVRMHERR